MQDTYSAQEFDWLNESFDNQFGVNASIGTNIMDLFGFSAFNWETDALIDSGEHDQT